LRATLGIVPGVEPDDGHVWAKHASDTRGPGRQACESSPARHRDLSHRSDMTALATRNDRKTDDGELLRVPRSSRRLNRRGISARAPFDPTMRRVFLTSRSARELRAGKTSPRSARADFLARIRPPLSEWPERAGQVAEIDFRPRAANARPRKHDLRRSQLVYGEDPSAGLRAGVQHQSSGFTFAAPRKLHAGNTRRPVIGVREGGTKAMRFESCACRRDTDARRLPQSVMGMRPRPHRGFLTQTAYAGSREAHGDQWHSRSMRCVSAANLRFISHPTEGRPRASATRAKNVNSVAAWSRWGRDSGRTGRLRIRFITVHPATWGSNCIPRMDGVTSPARTLFASSPASTPHTRVRVSAIVKTWWSEFTL